MSLRDDLLPVFDDTRGVIEDLGLRRFSVTLRRRTWSGGSVGAGVPTNDDIVISPTPRVRFKSPFAAQMSGILTAGGKIEDRYFAIDKITPAWSDNGLSGGYTPDQLTMKVGPDVQNVEAIVVLLGDDGTAIECVQVTFEEDLSFGYSMVVQDTDRPSVRLTSLAISPIGPMAPGNTQQLVAIGTYSDGSQFPMTMLAKWSSSAPGVATISALAIATAVSDGTTTIGARIGQMAAPPVVLTVSG